MTEADISLLERDRTRSRAAVVGHPLHPMLVPFPIAFLSAAFLTDIAFLRTRDRFWAKASRALLASGTATAALAAPLGLIDFVSVPAARRAPEAWLHGLGNAVVLGLAVINLGERLDAPEEGVRRGWLLSGAAGALLGVTGWLGGELSYRHSVGVDPR